MANLSTIQRKTAEIRPYERNPRKNDQAVDAVAASIRQFGFRQPVVVDGDGVIICGHTRWKAAQQLGLETIPVHVANDLTPEEVRAYRIADNKAGELATWDMDLLPMELAGLGERFDMSKLGFRASELQVLLAKTTPGLTDPDAVPEPPMKPRTKPGDLWLLGEHRLLCGDCTRDSDHAILLQSYIVNAVLTDPPYGIGFKYESIDDSRSAWYALMDKMVPSLKQLASIVVMPCCGIDRLAWWYITHKPDWLLCWYKGSPGHRSHVGFNDWEPHLVWGKPPSQMHDYWQTACGFEIDGHPCPKPAAYSRWLVERIATTGDAIYDPFVGSGTTIIACEQLGRRCLAMEIEPRYVDVAVKRWEEFTGRKAVLDKANGSARNRTTSPKKPKRTQRT